MLNGSTVFVASIGYVCFLFAVAWWGDHGGRRFVVGRRPALVYALSLAVYCTSWTYYGSVGLASAHGLDFLPIYIGPILVVGFGHRLIARIAGRARRCRAAQQAAEAGALTRPTEALRGVARGGRIAAPTTISFATKFLYGFAPSRIATRVAPP